MAALIGTLFAASFLDCLNPTAIAQQLLLQASLEKKRKIWFFIAGMFLTNLALGLVVYYGAAEPLLRLWRHISDSRPALAASLLLAIGVLCLTAGGLLSLRVLRSRRRKGEETEDKEGGETPPQGAFLPRAVRPWRRLYGRGTDQRPALFRLFGGDGGGVPARGGRRPAHGGVQSGVHPAPHSPLFRV